jgi:hypothetical protein
MSSRVGGGSTSKDGTSMSSPHAAAVAALLLQKDPGLTVNEIENILKTTGKSVLDSRVGRSFPRVDAGAAVNSLITPLTITVPENAMEGDGVLMGQGTVTVSQAPTINLTVNLESDDISEVTVPPTITILADQTSGAFDITIIDDFINDGSQTVTIIASALGYSSDTDKIVVEDRIFANFYMGIYRNGWWYLDSNETPGWNTGDTRLKFGRAGDIPATGDWDGDGYTDMGLFRNGWWYLDDSGTLGWNAGDTRIKFGIAGDIPVTGDWDADGYTDMGLFRNGWWYLDDNGTIGWNAGDTRIKFGMAGDIPVTGDWDADGYTDMGIFRNGYWYLDDNGTLGWNAGDTRIRFGIAGDIPVTGDWDGDGYTDIGIFRNGWWYLDSNGTPGWNAGDTRIRFGIDGDIPMSGIW